MSAPADFLSRWCWAQTGLAGASPGSGIGSPLDRAAVMAARGSLTRDRPMEERALFSIDYADGHGPVTVRQLYYQAEISGVPEIDKTEGGYNKVQRQVLALRQVRRLPYRHIADLTRWMRKPRTYNSVEQALQATPQGVVGGGRYIRRGAVREGHARRRDLSRYCSLRCASDGGPRYSSKTFCFESIESPVSSNSAKNLRP